MNNVKLLSTVLLSATLLGTFPGVSRAVDLSKLKGENVSVSPNGNFALWCRITKLEWLKNSWKIPLYPFVLAIGRHNWPLTTNFERKCTVVDKNLTDLFDWHEEGRAIWSPDGNSITGNGRRTNAHLLLENKTISVPTHSYAAWAGNNEILLVTQKDFNAVISTFDVVSEKSADVGMVPLPDWTKYMTEINLCNTRVKILAQDEYAPSGLTKSAVLIWSLNSHTLIEKREFERSVYGMIDVRKCD